MIAAPENSAAPATPSRNTGPARRPSACWAKAIRDSVPPSPLLSARMMTVRYLNVTTIIIDQKIRLTTPMMCSGSSASGCRPAKVTRNA